MTVKETTDARKEKRGREEALALAKTVSKIVVATRKGPVTVNLRSNAPDDETLVGYLLGPSGNLRAPTIRKGKTLYVGFNADAYQEHLS